MTKSKPQSDLATRVERAIAEAHAAVRRSQVLAGARRVVRDKDVLISRCAWCERHALAGHWIASDEAPAFLPVNLTGKSTHGICTDCIDRLRRDGLSR